MVKFEMLAKAAKSLFSDFLSPYLGEVKDTALNADSNAARDMVERVVTGRRTIEEWAEIANKGVDKIKNRIVNEEGLSFVGGKLNFRISDKNLQKVIISFELYFINDNREWQKIGAGSDMYSSNFTQDALSDITSSGLITFEVE